MTHYGEHLQVKMFGQKGCVTHYSFHDEIFVLFFLFLQGPGGDTKEQGEECDWDA